MNPGEKLTASNYAKGFLIDEELMAGVSEHPEMKGRFLAFVLRPATAEYLGYQDFESLDQALAAVNGIRRGWRYEATSGCGGGKCGKSGSCNAKSCAGKCAAGNGC